jgi:hypothetical protein
MRFGLSMVGIVPQYQDIPVGILLIIAVGMRGMAADFSVSALLKKSRFPVVNRIDKN